MKIDARFSIKRESGQTTHSILSAGIIRSNGLDAGIPNVGAESQVNLPPVPQGTRLVHSPGPWREDDGAIRSADGRRVADTYNEVEDFTDEEVEGNCIILAASLDSWAVCQELIHGDGTSESLQRAIDLARIALGLDKRA